MPMLASKIVSPLVQSGAVSLRLSDHCGPKANE
jgi:replication factor C subunit 1